jgi:transposase-like protein
MKRSRFTEEQIIGVLREQEAGMKVSELCRKHGISEPTFYAWKAKFCEQSASTGARRHATARRRSTPTGHSGSSLPSSIGSPEACDQNETLYNEN